LTRTLRQGWDTTKANHQPSGSFILPAGELGNSRVPQVSLLRSGSLAGRAFHPIPRYNLSMNRTAAEVLKDVRSLPPGEFDWLVGELLQAGDGYSAAEIEASWKAEVERRVAEAENGTAITYSWDEVEVPLRARLAK
jgi:hypothetical protein